MYPNWPSYAQPSEALASVVHRYEIYESRKDRIPTTYMLYPSFASSFFFRFSSPKSSFFIGKNAIDHDLGESYIVPPSISPLKFLMGEGQHVLRVIFKPGALSDLYPISLKEFTYPIKDLQEALGDHRDSGYLTPTQFTCPTAYIQAFEQHILHQQQAHHTGRDFFQRMYHICRQHFFLLSVQELADLLHLSRRHLNRLTNKIFGFSAKDSLRIMRFAQAVKLLEQKCPVSLPQIALQCGYADQSHFCHDFKSMTALTPKHYLKMIEEKELIHSQGDCLLNGLFLNQSKSQQALYVA
ncbi:MAG: helix-turn-helix domain-containing protein [Bacteroidota bacterium]